MPPRVDLAGNVYYEPPIGNLSVGDVFIHDDNLYYVTNDTGTDYVNVITPVSIPDGAAVYTAVYSTSGTSVNSMEQIPEMTKGAREEWKTLIE